MPRALWLADVLSSAGLKIKPYPGWESRGRSDFAPVGLMWHHTVTSPSTPDSTVDRILAVTGSSLVSAPLCNYSTNRDGTVSIIASGTANHGGRGGWQGKSGNRLFLGDEMKNRGTNALEPWPAVQLESARIAAAAVLDHIRRDASWLCGHKEYALPPGRKTDPHTLVMDAERARVAALMEENMAWTQPGDPVLDTEDADAVFAYQGTFAPGQNQASYDPAELQEANDRLWIVLARITDWAMRQ